MATKLTPKITKVALVDAGANPDADFVFYKAAEPLTGTEAPVADDIKKNLDEATARIAVLEAERTALNEMSDDDLAAIRGFVIAKAETVEIDKSALPEEVRKALENGEKLAVRVAKMEADARVESFQKVAAGLYAKVGDTDEIGAALAAISDDKVRGSVEKALAAANERIDMGTILKTVGKDGDAETDPIAKAQARAVEIRKANPELSVTDALSAAMREDPATAKDAFYATK